MDVNNTLRINSLMKELQKHGIAQSSQDAFTQAGTIYGQTAPPQGVQESPSPELQQQSPLQQHSNAAQNDPLMEQHITMMMDMQFKRYAQEITSLRGLVGSLQEELQSIRAEVKRAGESRPAQRQESTAQQSQQQQTSSQQSERQQEPPQQKQAAEPHPRQGNYKPGDVDLKQIFNFGRK